ncbi:MAG: 50S ribosomal protein L4 [Bacteroidales bacterium]|nr:50S ribosomal protein L4 [Bacteroidales bacterium]
MELEVYNINGQKTDKKVSVDDTVFGIEPNDHAIYLDIKNIMANRRQGTHSSKTKSLVSGSTRKLKRQKGTGTARFGSIKNPLFRGGARTFGPEPRDYSLRINKKLKKLARRSALSYKMKENGIIVLEDFSMETSKTKDFAQILKNFDLTGKKVLLVATRPDANLLLSSRNIQSARIVEARNICTYDILNANSLLIAESSLEEIQRINSAN